MRTFRALLVMAVAAVFLAGMTARASWFGRKSKESGAATSGEATRRYHLHVPDKATEQELLRLFSWKRTVAAQLLVLQQLANEKQQELASFTKGLEDKFSIGADRNYRFETKTRTIYELVPKAGAATGQVDTAEPYDQKVHQELKSEDQVRQYVQLAAGRKLAIEEMRVFQAVLVEKQAELNRVDQALGEKFSISRDRNYEYDSKTMRLYEIVAPEKKSAEAAGKAPGAAIPLRSGAAPAL